MSGTVTLDGKPLPDIRVTFQPQNRSADSAGAGSYALTDANGKYDLRLSDTQAAGAVVGTHQVTFADKLTEDPEDSDAGPATKIKSRIPLKASKATYTFEVKAGATNQADFELNGK